MEKELFDEINKWTEKYSFNFQFWNYNNIVFIYKESNERHLVEVYSTGRYSTPLEALIAAFDWVYRVNRTPKKNRWITKECIFF